MNRSHTSLLLLALSGSLLLAGCNQQAETSVVAPSASEVAAASATAAASAAAWAHAGAIRRCAAD